MRTSDVAITPLSNECGEVLLPTDKRRWQAHRTDLEPKDEPEVRLWCPESAEQEFMWSSPRSATS